MMAGRTSGAEGTDKEHDEGETFRSEVAVTRSIIRTARTESQICTDTSTFAYGMWTVVASTFSCSCSLRLALSVRKGGVEWRTMGIFIGFIVALFTEMYGLPLNDLFS